MPRIRNDREKTEMRARRLARQFGISLDEYGDMLESQNHRCKICDIEECPTGRNFAVDHDHLTGVVRGLLCVRCNSLLAMVNDEEDILLKAIKYLETATSIP